MTAAAPPPSAPDGYTEVSLTPAGASWWKSLLGPAAVLAVSLSLAGFIYATQARQSSETAVLKTAFVFATLLVTAIALYLLRTRRNARPATAGLVLLTLCAVLLLSIYLFRVSWYVFFPADFLTWSEGDFVMDMLKFSVGYPLFTPQVNNDSFEYVPGAQLLTYALAWLAGKAGSVPFYRVIQVCFTAGAAFLASLCCGRLLRISGANDRSAPVPRWLWNAFWFAALFLIATNSITNLFTHNLHGDALAQLVTMGAYYLLLVYIETRNRWVLAAMSLVAPAGFLVKQSLVAWAGCYAGFLALWGRSFKRLAIFVAATAGLVGAVTGICYAIWGQPFFFWTMTVLSKNGVSPLRSFQHLLDAWTYFAAGLLGGSVILTAARSKALLGAWLVGMGVLVMETYTSGIAWMLNHMGPGCLIAGVWFLTGVALIWERAAGNWMQAAAAVGVIALMFNGMGLIRIPLRPISDDANRYVRDIEHEFQGQRAENILMDTGTWVYWKDRVVMGDRGPGIGDRGRSQIGDFSGILSRIANKRYSKILMRGFHDRDFIYDYYLWPKSSGIRQALLDNYRETGRIPAAQGPTAVPNWAEDPYYFGEITILEPKAGL